MNVSRTTAFSRLEDLPNELFHEYSSYLTPNDLYTALSGLNSRFDALLMSLDNFHLEIHSSVDNQRATTTFFSSRIISASVPVESDAVAIAAVFPRLRSLILHRAIRLIPTTLPAIEHITLNLSNMRPKQAAGLCQPIFSDRFPSLRSFHLVHNKASVVGHWRPLINSIRQQCPTLTQFIFDMRPTIEWLMLVHLLDQMPCLERLIIRTLNTRTRWTLSAFAQTLKTRVPKLNYLFARLTSLGTTAVIQPCDDYRRFHPLFVRIISAKGKSRERKSATTIISSRA